MSKKVVILIQSDPAVSHRPVEAVRIALGLASCHLSVELILTETAARLLEDDNDDLINIEEARNWLSRLTEWVHPFWIIGETERVSVLQTTYKTSRISLHETAKKILDADSFISF